MPRPNQKNKESKSSLPSKKLRRTPVPQKGKGVTKTTTKGQNQKRSPKTPATKKPAASTPTTDVVTGKKAGFKKLADKYEALCAPKKSRSSTKKALDDANEKKSKKKNGSNDEVTTGEIGDGESITRRIESIKDSAKIRYRSSDFPKLVNVLGGESGKGLCYRNGIVRMGGAPFHKKMQADSESFILEFVYRLVTLLATNNRRIVTTEMVCKVSKSFGIDPVWIGE